MGGGIGYTGKGLGEGYQRGGCVSKGREGEWGIEQRDRAGQNDKASTTLRQKVRNTKQKDPGLLENPTLTQSLYHHPQTPTQIKEQQFLNHTKTSPCLRVPSLPHQLTSLKALSSIQPLLILSLSHNKSHYLCNSISINRKSKQFQILAIDYSLAVMLLKYQAYHTLFFTQTHSDKVFVEGEEYYLIRRIPKLGASLEWENLEKESALLVSLKSPHFLTPKEFLQNTKYYYSVFQFCSSPLLYSNLIHQYHILTHHQLISVFAQMVIGLETLQTSCGYYHGNINPSTFLFSENGTLVFRDIKGIKPLGKKSIKMKKGMEDDSVYVAPELYEIHLDENYLTDFWSLGALMYEAYYRKPPYQVYMYPSMVAKVHSIEFPTDSSVPKQAIDIIKKLLRKPAGRLGNNGWGEVKKHPYFNSVCWEGFTPRYNFEIMRKKAKEEQIMESFWLELNDEKKYQSEEIQGEMSIFKPIRREKSTGEKKRRVKMGEKNYLDRLRA